MKPDVLPTLAIAGLLDAYRARRLTVSEVISSVLDRIDAAPERNVWISRLSRDAVLAYAKSLDAKSPDSLPLYGVPFAIKDNIDLAGVPTTAGCPDYAYAPAQSSFVVQRLIDAGAIPLGKTNLDQFATGLVGTRSPYGACKNAIDDAYVSGGSSSGSAVAVASGLVSFSLGTDTAGSGRVPAGFNNIVGLKATCGHLSISGVVPACQSIDCVSIFALTSADTARVLDVAGAYDAADAYSRKAPTFPANSAVVALDAAASAIAQTTDAWAVRAAADTAASTAGVSAVFSSTFRFGVPRADQLEFFGDSEYERLYGEAVARLQSIGGHKVDIDFTPFRAAAKLLYEGAFIAERYVAVGDFIERQPNSVHPVTRQLITASRNLSAADAFRSQHRLMEARRAAEQSWGGIDILVTPTAGTIYRIADIEADPIRLNANLGYYTNFVNFLDLAAVAVPAGFRGDGLPFGVTLVGPAWSEPQLLSLADRLHRAGVDKAGALNTPLPIEPSPPIANPSAQLSAAVSPSSPMARSARPAPSATVALNPSLTPTPIASATQIPVAVCGAHLEGLPLNHQLTTRGATLLKRMRTAPVYRFYALPGGPPFRPGLIRVTTGGASIDVEVWSVPAEHFGSFVAGIPAPLGIGKVELEDGDRVPGFICEPHGIEGAKDITALGSWRAYIKTHA